MTELPAERPVFLLTQKPNQLYTTRQKKGFSTVQKRYKNGLPTAQLYETGCEATTLHTPHWSLDMTATTATAAKTRKTRSKTVAPVTPVVTPTDKVKFAATIVMGIAIPLLSLGLSNTGGNLARTDHIILAVLAFGLMGCVLTVSLSHLAWAVEDITKSPRWASWLLAITFDLVLVLAELCHVAAEDAGVGTVTTIMMVAVALLSMFLNCWAFVKHPAK